MNIKTSPLKKPVVVGFYIEEEQMKQIDSEIGFGGMKNRSDVLRKIVSKYLEAEKKMSLTLSEKAVAEERRFIEELNSALSEVDRRHSEERKI